MSTSKFWEYIDTLGPFEGWWGTRSNPEGVAHARELLLAEMPEAKTWLDWVDSDPKALTFDLLIALAWRSWGDPSPKPMRYRPEDVTLHLSDSEFQDILFQRPPRGAVTVQWDVYDEDGFNQPAQNERLVTFLRSGHLYADNDNTYVTNLKGGALVFIRGKKVDIYPFPRHWAEIVEYVHHELGKMTARDKARIELPHELAAFVGLLGWPAVDLELQKLKP